MAHNINRNNGRDSFVTKKELAWHRLGTVVESMTSKECMELAGLDYTVDLAPLVAITGENMTRETYAGKSSMLKVKPLLYTPDAKLISESVYNTVTPVSHGFASYRTDNNAILGIVGNRYEVIQNIEAFDFFDEVIGSGHAAYETAGALGNGETVFITAKLPSKLNVRKEDIDKYLLFTMSHDGSGSIKVMFTPIRVVCNNTLSAALESKERVTIKHTKNARARLEIVPQLLGITETATIRYEEVFNRFKSVSISEEEMNKFIDKTFNFEYEKLSDLSARSFNKRERLFEYYECGVGQEGIQGTLWGAYNTVTGFLQNGGETKADQQFKSDFMTTNANLRQVAMKNLIALAK